METDVMILTLITILGWGLWGFLFKIGIGKLGAFPALFWASIIYSILNFVIIAFLLFKGVSPQFTSGVGFMIAGCVAGSLAGVLWYVIAEKVEASIMVPLTALYPAVTVVLAIFLLGEKLKLTQIVGVLFALLAGALLAL